MKLASGRASALMSDCSARGVVSSGLCQSSSTEHEHQARQTSRHLFIRLISKSECIDMLKSARMNIPRRAEVLEHVDHQLWRKHRRRRGPARQRPRSILSHFPRLWLKYVVIVLQARRALAGRALIHPGSLEQPRLNACFTPCLPPPCRYPRSQSTTLSSFFLLTLL